MYNKTPKSALLIILGAIIMVVMVNTGCNNNADSKTTTTDTMNKSAVPDTTKMDSASTRPVVPAN